MEQNNTPPKNFLSVLDQYSAPTAESPQTAPTPATEEPGLLSRAGDFLSRAVSGGPFTTEAWTDLAKRGFSVPMKSEAIDAESLAEDTSAAPEVRLQAAEAVLQKEQDAANREAAKRSAAAQKYLNSLKTSEELNVRLKKMYGENTDKVVKLPEPEKFGITAADVAAYQRQVSGEVQTNGTSPTKKLSDEEIAAQEQQKKIEEMQREQMFMVEQDLARQNASLAAQMNYSDKMRQLMDQKIAQIDSEQQEIDKIDPERFWNSKSTPQRILGSLAIALGEIGRVASKSNTNTALEIINDAIKRDMDAQKITGDQRLMKEQNALRRIDAEINKFSQLSQDNLRKTELQRIQSGLRQQQMALKQQQAQRMFRQSLIASEGGIPPNMIRNVLSEEEIPRAVPLPNGNFVVSPMDAGTVEKFRKDIKTEGDLFNVMSNYLDIVSNYDFLNFEQRSDVDSRRSLLVGPTKKLVGESGAMTESDRKFILDTLGNPNWKPDVFVLPRIKAILQTVKEKRDSSYAAIGVKVPMTERERLFQQTKKEYPNLKDDAINAALDKKGYK